MTRTRFVEIPSDRLVATLESIGAAVAARGGAFEWSVSGRERVFDLTIPHSVAKIRVFTTLDGAAMARECGKDAVRVIVGVVRDDRFRPVEKGVKILRTAPKGGDRVQAWLDRLTQALRDAYTRAAAIKPCPQCGSALARREGKYGPFLGCTSFPKCKTIVRVAA